MAKKVVQLNDMHRAFLVNELACYATPEQAVEALKDAYGIEISRQGAEHYDPNKKAGATLHDRWKSMFEQIREEFLKQVTLHVPLANKSVRIRKLARAADSYERMKNYLAMADMLERIAKECGNVHTNRREHTGKDGGPIKYREVDDMTDEQVDAELDQLWAEATAAAKRESKKDVHQESTTEQ